MPTSDPRRRLLDIVENVRAVQSYTSGMDESDLAKDPLRRDAVERCLERISEAATKLGELAEAEMPDQPWGQIRALGNRLRHEYDRLDSRVL